MRRNIGNFVLLGLVVYLIANGAIVIRPREMGPVLASVIVSVVGACSTSAEPSLQDGAPLEEGREGHLVGNGKGHHRSEGHVDPAVLDDAEMLRMQSGQFGGCFLSQFTLFSKLTEAETESSLRGCDRLP